jgi:hypothetical protein
MVSFMSGDSIDAVIANVPCPETEQLTVTPFLPLLAVSPWEVAVGTPPGPAMDVGPNEHAEKVNVALPCAGGVAELLELEQAARINPIPIMVSVV